MEKEKGLKHSKLDEEIIENLDLVENLKMYEMMKDLDLQKAPAPAAGKGKDGKQP